MFVSKSIFILIILQIVLQSVTQFNNTFDNNLFKISESINTSTFKSNKSVVENLILDHYVWKLNDVANFWLDNSNSFGISCLLKFIKRLIISPKQLSVLIPDTEISLSISNILQQLNKVVPFFLLKRDIDDVGIYNFIENAIVILDNLNGLGNITQDELIDMCNSKCVFMVILTPIYYSEQHFLKEASEWVKIFYDRTVVDIGFIFRVNNTLNMAKSLSFEANITCIPSIPTILGICQDDSWINWQSFNIPMNLNNCTVHVGYFSIDPFVIINENYNHTTLSGTEWELLSLIGEKLNIHIINNQLILDDDKSFNEYIEDTLEEYDIIFGGLLWGPTSEIHFATVHEILPIIWLIPISSSISLRGIYVPLSDYVWIAIIVIFLIGAISIFLIFHDISLLEIFSIFLGVSWYVQPQRLSIRLYFVTWVIYGYVITNCYLASLAGQLITNSYTQMETIEDLVNSNLKFGGSLIIKQLFNDKIQHIENSSEIFNSVNKRLVKNFIAFDNEEYELELNNLLSGKSRGLALAVMLNFSSQNPVFNQNVYILKESLGSFPIAFAIREGLSYSKQLDNIIDWITTGGYMIHFAHIYQNYNDINDNLDTNNNLKLKHLIPAFILLAMGFVLAIIMFCGEYIHFFYVKKKLSMVSDLM